MELNFDNPWTEFFPISTWRIWLNAQYTQNAVGWVWLGFFFLVIRYEVVPFPFPVDLLTNTLGVEVVKGKMSK